MAKLKLRDVNFRALHCLLTFEPFVGQTNDLTEPDQILFCPSYIMPENRGNTIRVSSILSLFCYVLSLNLFGLLVSSDPLLSTSRIWPLLSQLEAGLRPSTTEATNRLFSRQSDCGPNIDLFPDPSAEI